MTEAQRAALSLLTPRSMDVEPLALDQAITAYLDERGARPGFFEQMDGATDPTDPTELRAAAPTMMEVIS